MCYKRWMEERGGSLWSERLRSERLEPHRHPQDEESSQRNGQDAIAHWHGCGFAVHGLPIGNLLPDDATENKDEHHEREEDDEDDLGDLGGTGCYARETEDARDDRDDEEGEYPA